MSNPFSGSDIPGMNAMGDTLSFVKKLWGNMQVPGMVAPPMSLDELDKKIQDLKTVESWLTVNMNMLRGTIQALEVQRATIAALQSLGESFAQHAQQAGAMAEQAASSAAAATTAAASAATAQAGSNADWPMHPAAAKQAVVKPGAVEPDPEDEEDEEAADMPPDNAAARAEAAEKPAEAQAVESTESVDASTPFVNPAAWWGLLQEQFKQAVNKAMEGQQAEEAVAAAVLEKKTTAKKTASKPVAKAAAKPASKPANKPATKVKTVATGKTLAKAATKPVSKPATKAAKTSKEK